MALKTIFMGTPQFAVPCLKALYDRPDLVEIQAVYTQPDRPAGRGQALKCSPVKEAALAWQLPIRQPENINRDGEPDFIASLKPDLIVVVAYAHFLGTRILNIPPLGCINVHSSLLPAYRGAAPIQFAVLNGEKKSGVSIMKLVKEMDAGPVYKQALVDMPITMTSQELHDALCVVGPKALIETIEDIKAGTAVLTEQDHSKASFAKIIEKDMGLLDLTRTKWEIYNQIRALNPWPGTFLHTNRGLLKILKANFSSEANLGENSDFLTSQNGKLWLKVSMNSVNSVKPEYLEILQLQLEGKKAVSASDFINGMQSLQWRPSK